VADQRGYVKEGGEDVSAEDLLDALRGESPEPEGGPRGVYTEALPPRMTRGFGRTETRRP